MSDINARFKKLRMACEMSQEEWGAILGITKSGVSDVERGKRNVTNQHLIMLSNWKEKPVNIEWLRTGEGDMFRILPEEDELSVYIEELLDGTDDKVHKAIRAFLMAYGKMNSNSKKVMNELIDNWLEEMKKEKEQD